MKNKTSFFLLLFFLFAHWKLFGQVDKEQAQAYIDSTKFIPASSLQQGGSYTDPVSSKGLTLSSDLNLSESKQVFGFDALTLNARWVPGTNSKGSRIFINLGTANWFSPALSEIYDSTVLTQQERFQQSVTAPDWIAGIGVRLLDPPNEISEKLFEPFKNSLNELFSERINAMDSLSEAKRKNDTAIANEQEAEIKRIKEEEENILWKISREHARKARWTVGSNFRLVDLGESSNIDVFDIYTTFARGKGDWDFSGAFHFVTPREKSLLLRNAFTVSAGAFLDLDSLPPMRTLAAIFRYGYYNFRRKEIELTPTPGDPPVLVHNRPLVHTFDVTLTFSGLRGSGIFGSGLGFRYAVRANANFDTQTEFAVLFTSKFVKERKQ